MICHQDQQFLITCFVSLKVSAYSNTDRLSRASTKHLHSSSIIKQTGVKRFLKPTAVFYLIYSEGLRNICESHRIKTKESSLNMITHVLQSLSMSCLVGVLLCWAGSVETDAEQKLHFPFHTAPPSKYLTIAKEQPCNCYFNPHTLLWQMMGFFFKAKFINRTAQPAFKVRVTSAVSYNEPIKWNHISPKKRTPSVLHRHVLDSRSDPCFQHPRALCQPQHTDMRTPTCRTAPRIRLP